MAYKSRKDKQHEKDTFPNRPDRYLCSMSPTAFEHGHAPQMTSGDAQVRDGSMVDDVQSDQTDGAATKQTLI